VLAYLEQFVSKNKGDQALKVLRTTSMQGTKLFAYYKTISKQIADTNSTVNFLNLCKYDTKIDGLNPNSVPSNLKLMMQAYLTENPTSTVSDLSQQAEHILTLHMDQITALTLTVTQGTILSSQNVV
jgi:hypothetical protein